MGWHAYIAMTYRILPFCLLRFGENRTRKTSQYKTRNDQQASKATYFAEYKFCKQHIFTKS